MIMYKRQTMSTTDDIHNPITVQPQRLSRQSSSPHPMSDLDSTHNKHHLSLFHTLVDVDKY